MPSFQETSARFFRRFFDIREGELSRALLMQLNIFLIITTLLIIKPVVNSLFLSFNGVEALPRAFVMVAIAAAVVSTVYSRLLNRTAFIRLVLGTQIGSVFTLFLFGILLHLNMPGGTLMYIFYIWVALFGLLVTSQFWILGNLLFSVREAKRLFGFIGAGAIAGGIFGGYLTRAFAGWLGSENLVILAGLLLSLCIPITIRVWKENISGRRTEYQQRKRMGKDARHPLRLIRNSRHLTYLALLVGVSVVVAKLVEYLFGGVASAHFQDPDRLTAFFGFWFSTLNIISLSVQLLLTHRVVGVLGVGRSLYFLPGGIFVGAVIMLFSPGLLAAVFMKVSDGSLKQSINKAAMELLALPIPAEIKNRTKSFIDVFVDSFASGAAGLLLIFVVNGLELNVRAISIVILLLVLLWAYLADQVRREYLASFKKRLLESRERLRLPCPRLAMTRWWEACKRVMATGSESQILYILEKIRESSHPGLFTHLKSLLEHPNPQIRAEALRDIYFYKFPSVLEEAVRLSKDPEPNVRVRAIEYLLEHSREDRFRLIQEYLGNPDAAVNRPALVSVAAETRNNPHLQEKFGLAAKVRAGIRQLDELQSESEIRDLKRHLLKVSGAANIREFYPFIHECLEDPNPDVQKQAMLTAGQTLHGEFTPRLSALLAQPEFAEYAARGLFLFGPDILDFIEGLMEQPGTELELLRALPKLILRFDIQRSVDLLFMLLHKGDPGTRNEALQALQILKDRFPHLKFNRRAIITRILGEAKLYLDTLSILYAQSKAVDESSQASGTPGPAEEIEAREGLIALLESRLKGNLDRIFQLLHLKYPTDDIIQIYDSLRSDKEDLRSNALEFLENLLEPNLKKVLLPIVETTLLDSISEDAVHNLKLRIPDEYACFEMLLQGGDRRVILHALQLIAKLNDRRYLEIVAPLCNFPDENVSLSATAAMAELRS